MKTTRLLASAGLLLAAMVPCAAAADVVLQTRHLRLQIGADAIVRSLQALPSGDEYAWVAEPAPLAAVYRGGQTHVGSQEQFVEDAAPLYRGGQCFPATAASLAGDRLTVRFAGAGVTATYQVTAKPDYLALKLIKLEGEPVDRIDLLRLRIKRLPYLGPWIDVAYDDRFGICLCAGNIQTNAGMNRSEKYVELRAMAEKDVALEGTTAVLLGCPEPKRRFLDAMEVVERDFHMPSGARNRRSPVQKISYLWCSPTPEDIGQYCELAKRAGLRMVFFSYRAFTKGAGHFEWNEKYPGGMADLKKVTGTVRAAGLKLGLHIHYSKADRTDPYVTPVPDDRLRTLRTFTLSGPIDAKAATLPVSESPAGSTRDKNRRILKLGRELVAYTDYTTSPPYRFTGCQRGHLKTAASPHGAGDAAKLLDVDDWTLFIRFDQDTDIQDEAARRIAELVNESGPYDMVYFDGAEDVHDPFWYHVAAAQHRVYRLWKHEPAVCEAALSSHFSWHMLSRGNAYDVPGKYTKSFCREVACRTAPLRAMDFTRIEFGWLFGLYDYNGPDVLEYVLSRGAAWDCPFSIRISPQQVAAHPRAEDCLAVIKTWEDARIGGHLGGAQRQMLKTLDPREYRFVKVWDAVKSGKSTATWKHDRFADQEHHLFLNEQGKYELVAVDEIPGVDGGRLKAYSFRRASKPGLTYVLLWAVRGDARLRIPVDPARLRVMRPMGTRLAVERGAGAAVVSVGSRRYLEFDTADVKAVRQMLRKAQRLPARPAVR